MCCTRSSATPRRSIVSTRRWRCGPGDVNALENRGNALLALGRPQDALACFDAVLARNPRHGDALLNRGGALASLGRTARGARRFRRRAGADAGASERALQSRQRAVGPRPLRTRPLAAFDRALAAAPGHVQAPGTTAAARCRRSTGTPTRSPVSTRRSRCKRIMPTPISIARSACSRSAICRAASRNTNGAGSAPACATRRRGYGKPLWLGEYPLARKTILLHAEQGLGDTIQFARYVPLWRAARRDASCSKCSRN